MSKGNITFRVDSEENDIDFLLITYNTYQKLDNKSLDEHTIIFPCVSQMYWVYTCLEGLGNRMMGLQDDELIQLEEGMI